MNNNLVSPFWKLANDSIDPSYISLNTDWFTGRSGGQISNMSPRPVDMKDLLLSHKLSGHVQERFSLFNFNEKAGFRWNLLRTKICIFLHIFSQHYLPKVILLHSSSVCLRILTAYWDPSQIFFLDFLSPPVKTCLFFIFLPTLWFPLFLMRSQPYHNGTSFFSLADFSNFSLSLAFTISVSLCVNLSYLESLSFLEVWMSALHQIWEVFGPYFFEYVPDPFSLLSFWYFLYVCIGHLMLSHLSEALLFFSSFLSVLCIA